MSDGHFHTGTYRGGRAEEFPYEVVTAPRGNRFGARSLEQVKEFKRIWTVTEVIDNTSTPPIEAPVVTDGDDWPEWAPDDDEEAADTESTERESEP